MWNGSNWSSVGIGISNESDVEIHVMIFGQNNLYVGGEFSKAGYLTNVGSIAMWDGSNWTALGNGLYGTNDFEISALAYDPNSNLLYAGGDFGSAFTNGGLAIWNGSHWTDFATGINTKNGTINSMIFNKSTLIIGGVFNQIGSLNTGSIAQLNFNQSTSFIPTTAGIASIPIANTSSPSSTGVIVAVVVVLIVVTIYIFFCFDVYNILLFLHFSFDD